MKPTHRLRFLLIQASAALALLVNQATAATFTWDGSDTAFWNLTANWVGGVAPVSANTTDIIISGTANVSTMLPGAVSYTIKSLTFDATNDADVRFTMTSTTNVSQSARNLTFNSNSGNATLAVESGSTGNKTIDRIGTINPATIILTSSLDVIHNGSGTLTLGNAVNASVTGVGGINKSGTGTLSLPAANTYTGATTINAGTLRFPKTASFYSAVVDATTAAKLTVNSGGTAAFNIGGAGEFTEANIVTLLEASNGTVGFKTDAVLGLDTTNADGGNFTPVGAIANPAGSTSLGLTKLGTGKLTLSGANSYGGATTVNAGTLQFTKTASFYNDVVDATTAAKFTINSGGTAAFNIGGAGEFTAANIVTLLGASNGTLGFKTGAILGLDTTNADGGNFTPAGAIDNPTGSTSLGLTKLGAGTLTLNVTNTYAGTTTLSAGVLNLGVAESVGVSGPLGNSAAANPGSIVLSGGTLQYSASNTHDYSGRFSTAVSQSYNVDTNGQNVTWATNLTSTDGTLSKNGAGTLTLAGANIHAGATTVSGGTLALADTNALQNSTLDTGASGSQAVSFTAAGTNTYALGGLQGSDDLVAGADSLSVGSNGSTTTFAGVISSSGGLTKSGIGALTLTAANTYSGATTISAGILHLGAGGTTGSLNTSSAISVASAAAFAVNQSDTVTQGTDFSGAAISGAGLFRHLGLGTTILNVANTYSGRTDIQGGKVIFTNSSAFGTTSEIRMGTTSGNTQALEFGADGLNLARLVVIQNAPGIKTMILDLAGTNTGTLSGALQINRVGSGEFVINTGADDTLTVSGNVTGTGAAGITKTGAGTLSLTNAGNNYTGATKVTAGTLSLTGSLTGGGAISTSGTGILSQSAAGVISGASTLIQGSAGTSILSGANTYTGATTVTAGTLAITSGSSASPITVNTGAVLELSADSTIISTIISTASLTLVEGSTVSVTGSPTLSSYTLLTAASITGTPVLAAPVAGYLLVKDGNSLKLNAASTGPGPLDHFVISAISSPQTVGTPITGITITAQDASNATATGFTGTVTFSGSGGFTGTSASFTAGVLNGVSVTPTVSGPGLTLIVTDEVSAKTGTATITTIQSQYDAWADGAAFDADTNGDGVKNGLAFLLGAGSPATAITLPTVSQSGGNLTMAFNYLKPANRGSASLSVEHSSNLGISDPWTAVPVTDVNSGPTSGVTFVVTAGDGSANGITATISSTEAASGKLFARLNATQIP